MTLLSTPFSNQMHLLFFLLFLLTLSTSSSTPETHSLLLFKSQSDPFNNLHSWLPFSDPCSSSSSPWLGISCLPNSSYISRIVLENLNLHGLIQILTSSFPHLRVLSLKRNRLSGPIPDLSSLPSLRLLFLSHNLFSSSLPPSLSSLPRLSRLDLSFNRLSGPLFSAFSHNTSRVLTLRLNSNNFSGSISHLSFPSLQELDLSHNSLSGPIPFQLSKFPGSAFADNADLCGPPLPSCKIRVPPASALIASSPEVKPDSGGGKLSRLAIVVIVVGDFLILVVVALMLFWYFWRKLVKRGSSINESSKIVYSTSMMYGGGGGGGGGVGSNEGGFERGKMVVFDGKKRFELEDLLKASAEMLGRGVYGTSYKAVLGDGNVVAVKRLREVNGGGGVGKRDFESQMEVIARLKHDNLVEVKAYYYARDEKLLVYEFMPSGSLFSLLHGNRGPGRTPLDWTTRMRIAASTARGLAAIHHHHNPSTSKPAKLYHGNIKSTNILMDKSFTPKLSDFALAPLFTSQPPRTANAYTPPESILSQKADIYSFGVVLLEILTGKVVSEDVNLPQWVQSVVREEWTSEVFDLELMRYKGVEEEMVGMLQIAMACAAIAPQQRPKIGQVLEMIEEIRGNGSPAYESYGEIDSSPCVSDDTTTMAST